MRGMDDLRIEPRGDRELIITRSFDAPRRLVFDALTKPELIRRWLGVFGGWTFRLCEVDLRVGGSYRYVWNGPDGESMVMRGVFREISPPDRIVHTESFDEPWYPGEVLVTSVLTETAGRTTLTSTTLCDTRDVRDGILSSGMEKGLVPSYAALDEILAAHRLEDAAS